MLKAFLSKTAVNEPVNHIQNHRGKQRQYHTHNIMSEKQRPNAVASSERAKNHKIEPKHQQNRRRGRYYKGKKRVVQVSSRNVMDRRANKRKRNREISYVAAAVEV
jgi:hypothetical protein